MYNTDETTTGAALEYDCLDYYVYRKKIAYQDLFDVTVDVIPYCFRAESSVEHSLEPFVHPLARRLCFDAARLLNITSEELFSWSVSVETVDRYQDYLNSENPSLTECFYNCTPPWFGVRCQYSFGPLHGLPFNEIVEATLIGQQSSSQASEMVTSVPCYALVECHRYGKKWCLDWREFCNGVIDCFDEGVDEEGCFTMETNECNANEYRCHNGLCIAEELWEEGDGEVECLDQSDGIEDAAQTNTCHQDPKFRCEEHSCRPNGFSFPCGDGECVRRFDPCHNGRHHLLIQSTMEQGNLSTECWITMVCLTRLIKQINGTSCEVWLQNNPLNESLSQCDSLFQFPILPIYSNYARFFYENVHLRTNLTLDFSPDYVCYDPQLCEFSPVRSLGETLSCRPWWDFLTESDDIVQDFWSMIVERVAEYFRSCMVSKEFAGGEPKLSSTHSMLYRCHNSLKSISPYRIRDTLIDCIEADDETFANSCSFNHRYRVKCGHAKECWSPFLKRDACSLSHEQSEEVIPFQSFCDGIDIHYYHDLKENKHTEEDGCDKDKLCDNMYARCDGYWACPDGRDESHCSQQLCPSRSQACVCPVNYTVYCLPHTRVNDSKYDCLGATDEQYECRHTFRSEESGRRFRCLHDEQCLSTSELCNGQVNCPTAKDDEMFCDVHQFTCQKNASYHRSKIEQVLCGLNEDDDKRIRYFSVVTSPIYPTSQDSFIDGADLSPAEQHAAPVRDAFSTDHNAWFYDCHRGLTIMNWMNATGNHSRRCLCPASYYGDRCQFQNQRVSVTLRLSSENRYATYGVVTMLMDDDTDEIITFNQFQYVTKESCIEKFSQYLLYSTRPKNVSKNYSVRIDVIEKNRMAYVGHWHFPIPFLFLPVNRMGISLNLSDHLLQPPSSCSINCSRAGECVKYVNKAKHFCRCPPLPTNTPCYAKMNCRRCSSGSICIGAAQSRPICVCPLSHHGSRCLQSTKCPPDACENGGQCIWNDRSISGSSYTCVCRGQYFGPHCEHQKWRLDVSLAHLDVPTHLIAYFFTVSNRSKPANTVILRKLTLFQRTVTFHIAIPFHLVYTRIGNQFYRAFLQHSSKMHTLTTISPKQECPSVRRFFNSTLLELVAYERIVHFHELCWNRWDLICFIDDAYLCLCTNDHHANCVPFSQRENFDCASHNYCLNEGRCYQDHPSCPSTKICICPGCFFGRECQLYAKGLGSTLDEILGYELEREQTLFGQPFSVQLSALITMLIFVIGIINGVSAIMTFSQEKPREVGCGMYLLASSVTSLMTVTLFATKFWLLFFSYRDMFNTPMILVINCRCVEVLLKLFLYMDNWVNACVALERTYSISQGLHFDKVRSRHLARITIPVLFGVNVAALIPQMVYLHVFEDHGEKKTWCVITYKGWLKTYNLTMIFIHYFVPLCVQFGSTVSIILITARQRSAAQADKTFWTHLIRKVRKYKQLLISPVIIIVLTLPHLVIAIILDCDKSSRLFWFYLIGYFLSFVPAAFVFLIFVTPSPLYRKQFKQCLSRARRRIRSHQSF